MLTTILRRTLPIILRHAVWTLCLAEGLAHGQVPTQPELPPREVNLCDLLRNPNPYDGQRIRVRGEANRDFQDFSLHGQSCGSQVAHRVWLQYGDDKTNAGEEMEHRFIQAEPLVKDAGYTAFAESLSQQRLLQPDLRACGGSQCHYYRVTASFTGRFFAGIEPGRGRGVKTFTGFGYQGCCHLLVIEQVSDVRTERTQTPVGGQYQCSTETWTPATSCSAVLSATGTATERPGRPAAEPITTASVGGTMTEPSTHPSPTARAVESLPRVPEHTRG